MANGPYDQASRYAARIDPPAFLAWVLDLPPEAVAFAGWLDTRNVALPGDPDRTNDTIARLDDPDGTAPPWALVVEYQSRPDPDMFARLFGYFSGISLGLRPDPEPRSRYAVGAAVLNLTGAGSSSRRMVWERAELRTELLVVERNLEHEPADALLRAIEAGQRSRTLLAWVPLMTGAGAAPVVEWWKRLAEAEPDARRRSDYAALARVFAERAGREELWEAQLEGWNVDESTVVNSWIARGEAKSLRASIIRLGTKRLGAPSAEQRSALDKITDIDHLVRLEDRLLDATSWDDLLSTP